MNPQDQHHEIVNKEDIPNYHFVSFEVLETKEEKAKRFTDLEKAMRIGNGENHHKIKIFFMTVEGPKEVITTVWAATDSAIVLKGGVTVPLHAILRIEWH